ncbi:cold shock domain-containing protein [Ferribacterium limneticum]|uniref:cold shock domain-containing protein n=1 Tax=Ferribacterium limneticum TaxID=76259 RepID=UPI001CF99949|nr:cold shock domain-containing protein [Ferribacterium limneticum]UCV29741.1 cold shock domain-containing protein [Ferribacterium limneticum]UCV33660.1 cold shock domain-containing protein [Ferribacterium limneticum]
MDTRIDGKLKTWNDEKGFGFITPTNGGQDIFVHISKYPRQGGKPVIGEALSFEVALNADGKKNAVNVHRPAQTKPAKSKPSRGTPARGKGSFFGTILSACFVAGLGYMGYLTLQPKSKASQVQAIQSSPATIAGRFRCDGRRFCSDMTSCEEATYFLRNCPNTEMDGDGDGIPCESQWCTGPFAK